MPFTTEALSEQWTVMNPESKSRLSRMSINPIHGNPSGLNAEQLKQDIHLNLRIFVMSKSKIDFVEPKAFTINFPSIGAPMTIRTESDEVVILMRLTLRPWDNMMNFNFDVSTSGNSAAVTGLDKDAPADFSRYWRTPIPA